MVTKHALRERNTELRKLVESVCGRLERLGDELEYLVERRGGDEALELIAMDAHRIAGLMWSATRDDDIDEGLVRPLAEYATTWFGQVAVGVVATLAAEHGMPALVENAHGILAGLETISGFLGGVGESLAGAAAPVVGGAESETGRGGAVLLEQGGYLLDEQGGRILLEDGMPRVHGTRAPGTIRATVDLHEPNAVGISDEVDSIIANEGPTRT